MNNVFNKQFGLWNNQLTTPVKVLTDYEMSLVDESIYGQFGECAILE